MLVSVLTAAIKAVQVVMDVAVAATTPTMAQAVYRTSSTPQVLVKQPVAVVQVSKERYGRGSIVPPFAF